MSQSRFLQLYFVFQGIFYATLMVFWMVFTGEHMINEDGATGEKSGIVAYWKKLAVVLFGCLCLFVFDMCERGVQVQISHQDIIIYVNIGVRRGKLEDLFIVLKTTWLSKVLL